MGRTISYYHQSPSLPHGPPSTPPADRLPTYSSCFDSLGTFIPHTQALRNSGKYFLSPSLHRHTHRPSKVGTSSSPNTFDGPSREPVMRRYGVTWHRHPSGTRDCSGNSESHIERDLERWEGKRFGRPRRQVKHGTVKLEIRK